MFGFQRKSRLIQSRIKSLDWFYQNHLRVLSILGYFKFIDLCEFRDQDIRNNRYIQDYSTLYHFEISRF